MPSSIGDYRAHIGQQHNLSDKFSLNCTEQQNRLTRLARNPGDPVKRARAELMLQVFLVASNVINNNINESPTSAAIHDPKSKEYGRSLLTAPSDNGKHVNISIIERTLTPASLPDKRKTEKQRPRPDNARVESALPSPPRFGRKIRSVGPVGTLPAGPQAKQDHQPSGEKKDLPGAAKPSHTQDVHATDATQHQHQKQRLAHFLHARDLIALQDSGKGYHLLNTIVDYIRTQADGLGQIARQLLKFSGDFGARRNEILGIESQYQIFNQWLEKEIFPQGLGEFVARQLDARLRSAAPDDKANLADSLYRSLLTRLAATNSNNKGAAEPGETLSQTASDFIIDKLIMARLPALRFLDGAAAADGIAPGGIEWGYLHAGLLFAKSLSLDSDLLSRSEAIQFGHSLEDFLRLGVAPPEQVVFFQLPAMLYYLRNLVGVDKGPIIDTLFATEEGIRKALLAFFAENERLMLSTDPFNLLRMAFEGYQTRTKLAAAGAQDADEAFKQQNENIGARFAVVDELLFTEILTTLPAQEHAFITKAAIKSISAVFSAFDTVKNQQSVKYIPRSAYTIDMKPTVDLLSACFEQEIRIYALEQTTEGYQLERVDRWEENYYPLMVDEDKSRTDKEYKLKIYGESGNYSPLKNQDQSLQVMITAIVKEHKKTLVKHLHAHGFEETTAEQVKGFLLSMLPLYDCITGTMEGKSQATVSCMIDGLMFLPAIGQTGRLAVRAAQKGALGGMMAYRQTLGLMAARASMGHVMKAGGKNFIRYAAVPVAEEISLDSVIQIGRSISIALDPGILLGYRATRSMTDIVRQMYKRMPAWNKNLPRLEQRLAGNAAASWMDNPHRAKLAGTDIEVNAVKVGVSAGSPGQDIYVVVHSDVIGRKKYTLSADNVLTAVPETAAKQMRIMTTYGLSGRGAPAAARQFAAQNAIALSQQMEADMVLLFNRWLEQHSVLDSRNMRDLLVHLGQTDRRFRQYVSSDNLLSDLGETLLRQSGSAIWEGFSQLPLVAQLETIGTLDARLLNRFLQALNAYYPLPPQLEIWRSASNERFAVLKTVHLANWRQWAAAGPHYEDRMRAVTALSRCFDSGEQSLVLSQMGLESLPDLLPGWLIELTASGNRLKELPANLPDGLRLLDISSNRIEALADNLPATLMVLNAKNNKLTRLPSRLPVMLTKLDVAGNALTHLPTHLPQLKELVASINQLEEIPPTLPDSIEVLKLDKNRLTALSGALPQKMMFLDASHNGLRELPASLPAKLTYLHINENLIKFLPASLPMKLKELRMTHNNLLMVPNNLPPSLTHIYLSNNLLEHLPNALPQRLKFISADNNLLVDLPERLPPQLKSLRLDNNLLLSLGESLPHSLENIFAADNHLTSLPAVFPRNLKTLDVSRNSVLSRPAHLPATVQFINQRPSLPD